MTNKHSTSPLRQRMIEDMTMRKLNPKTQSGYIRAVKKLTQLSRPFSSYRESVRICGIFSCTWWRAAFRVSR